MFSGAGYYYFVLETFFQGIFDSNVTIKNTTVILTFVLYPLAAGTSFIRVQKNIVEGEKINKLLNDIDNKTKNQTVISTNSIILQSNICLLFNNQLVEASLYFSVYVGFGVFIIYLSTGILINE